MADDVRVIAVEQFMTPCGCRSVGECVHNLGAEAAALDALVDAFAAAMKAKLQRQRWRGWRGWDDPANRNVIRARLAEHLMKPGDQWVDVANFAAMLWNLGPG
jgi:hypothetical protein